MLKPVISIACGLVLAFALVFASDALFHALSPSAGATPDPNDADAMRDYVARQPVGVLVALVLGWSVAVFAGSAVASRFGGRGEWPGQVVTALFLAATAANFLMVEHPTWMVVAGIAAILLAGWLGSRTGARQVAIAGNVASRPAT